MIYKLKTFHLTLNIKESKRKVSSAESAHQITREIFKTLDADQEHMLLLALNAQNQIRGYKVISSGGVTSTDPDLKIIFRAALLLGAVSIILAHNHPSGNPEPSEEDKKFTRKVKEAGEIVNITVLDHVIITESGYYSFSEKEA